MKNIIILTLLAALLAACCPTYQTIGQPIYKGKAMKGHFDTLYQGKHLGKAVRALESNMHVNKGVITK